MASQRQHQRVVMTRWSVVLFVSSQRRPTKANAGPQRRRRAQTTIGMCFLCTIILFYFYNESSSRKSFFYYYYEAQKGPQQLTTANEGQRRPTKTKKGPNDDRYVFFMYNHFILFLQRVVIP